jgi:hypothetical protein
MVLARRDRPSSEFAAVVSIRLVSIGVENSQSSSVIKMAAGPIMIKSANGPRFWPMGVHVGFRLIITSISSQHVWGARGGRPSLLARVSLARRSTSYWSPAARPIEQKVFVFARTAGEAFSAGGISGFDESV